MKISQETIFSFWAFLFSISSLPALRAQSCEGEAGTQLFLEDFGNGSGPGPSLPVGTTTYNYGNIGGGNYVVTNSTGLNGSFWHDALDHTPNDVDGYCLLFDAASTPGIFYNALFDDLCPNTKYTFSCYVANVVRPFACGGNSIEPNIKFSLLDPSNSEELGSVTTGPIETTEDITWNQYSVSFTTNQNQQEILIQMINNASGGCGNDLAIDDLTFTFCNPILFQEFDLCNLPNNMIQVGTETYSLPGIYQTIINPLNSCHDSIVYTILNACSGMDIPCEESYFPNAFSPNYDGINDYFKPFLSNCITSISTFQIFDRWGDAVHILNNTQPEMIEWDGRFESKEVSIGVYTFFLDAKMFDNSTKVYKGDITLIR